MHHLSFNLIAYHAHAFIPFCCCYCEIVMSEKMANLSTLCRWFAFSCRGYTTLDWPEPSRACGVTLTSVHWRAVTDCLRVRPLTPLASNNHIVLQGCRGAARFTKTSMPRPMVHFMQLLLRGTQCVTTPSRTPWGTTTARSVLWLLHAIMTFLHVIVCPQA